MADYAALLKQDLVEQFKEKPVIEALMEAIGEQLTDVWTFFHQLETERSVDTSVGKQLDGAGDIVVLTRKEAGELACVNESVYVLDDETYRKFLIYKIWKNTNNCTYYDIIKSFKMFWDKPLHYSEDPEVPATMIFETDELSTDDDVQKLLTAPFIKAAGVAIKVIAYTKTPMPDATVPVIAIMGRGYQSTTLPEIEVGIDLDDTVRTIPAVQNITQTILPEMEVKE